MEIFNDISIYMLVFVMAGGFLAGFVDSIAGGGGLISLPVLMTTGIPPHLAVGTNKFSATFGAVMSAWQFVRAGKVDMHLMKRVIPFTFIGAVIGCVCMLHMSAKWLQPIIILALNTYKGETKKSLLQSMAAALAIGFYDGFIGPGTGTFLIVAFAMIGFDFIIAAGNAKILNLVSNITAFVLLVYSGKILYVYGVAMAVCIFSGAYFGSRMAIHRGTGFVRGIMLTVTILLIGKLALTYAGII